MSELSASETRSWVQLVHTLLHGCPTGASVLEKQVEYSRELLRGVKVLVHG